MRYKISISRRKIIWDWLHKTIIRDLLTTYQKAKKELLRRRDRWVRSLRVCQTCWRKRNGHESQKSSSWRRMYSWYWSSDEKMMKKNTSSWQYSGRNMRNSDLIRNIIDNIDFRSIKKFTNKLLDPDHGILSAFGHYSRIRKSEWRWEALLDYGLWRFYLKLWDSGEKKQKVFG